MEPDRSDNQRFVPWLVGKQNVLECGRATARMNARRTTRFGCLLATPETRASSPADESTGFPERFYLGADEIFFENSARINIEGKAFLDEIIQMLKINSNKTWRIEGHMDSQGSERFLRTRSLERAKAVLEYFVLFGGLNRENFQVYGMGDKFPISDNTTEAGRKRNRRIEIKLDR